MRSIRAILFAVLCLVGAVLSLVACPGMDVCTCNLCGPAVELTVVERDSQLPLGDFFVEVILDGVSQGEPQTCESAFREENSCAFGDAPGVYVVVIQAPGYETLEASVRVAAQDESELCCRACLSGKPLRVEMTPEPIDD